VTGVVNGTRSRIPFQRRFRRIPLLSSARCRHANATRHFCAAEPDVLL